VRWRGIRRVSLSVTRIVIVCKMWTSSRALSPQSRIGQIAGIGQAAAGYGLYGVGFVSVWICLQGLSSASGAVLLLLTRHTIRYESMISCYSAIAFHAEDPNMNWIEGHTFALAVNMLVSVKRAIAPPGEDPNLVWIGGLTSALAV